VKAAWIFLGAAVCCGTACRQSMKRELIPMEPKSADAFATERNRMVQEQIIARGVRDTLVLNAMRRVPRHRYVPDAMRSYAYEDEPLPIGHNQTISQPYIVAFMTEALSLRGDETVLEIGTGSGYQAAVLAEIVRAVYTIEIVEPLAAAAERLLKAEGYTNVHCRAGDGYRGWPEQAPFDAVIVTAAPKHVPEPLVQQLKNGGRLVVPVGEWSQELILLIREGETVREKRLLPVRFVPMTGEAERQKK